MKRRSLAAVVCAFTGVLGALLAAGGALGANRGWVAPLTGFLLFLPGLVLGVLALILAIPALLRTRAGSGRTGRGNAVTGAVLGGGLTVLALTIAGPSRDLPRINDITTDPDDPPAFRVVAELPAHRGRDLGYPGAGFAALQRSAYPDLAPIALALPPREAFEAVSRAADALGWTPVAADAAAGTLEASEVSRVFRFIDDVVVRVRTAPGGAVVDVRSRSRDGRGDLGVNAERIRRLRSLLLSE